MEINEENLEKASMTQELDKSADNKAVVKLSIKEWLVLEISLEGIATDTIKSILLTSIIGSFLVFLLEALLKQ